MEAHLAEPQPSQDVAGVPPPDRAMAVALRRLGRFRTLIQVLLVAQRLAWLAAAFLGLALLVGLVDYFLRSPGWMRGVALVFGVVGFVGALRTLIIPALRFSPPLEEVALRIEQSDAGRAAGLTGVAASGVGLAVAPIHNRATSVLSMPVQREAARRLAGLGLFRFVYWRPVLAAAAASGAVMAVVLGILAVQPRMAWIGAVRVLAPWAGVEWPKRLDIEDATHQRVHALGTAMVLRAGVLAAESSVRADDTIEASFRLVVDGSAGPIRRVTLTRQDRTERITVQSPSGKPEHVDALLFESLIEPSSLRPRASAEGAGAGVPPRAELEYWFTSADDQTPPVRITLVAPPTVTAAFAKVTPPTYAQGFITDRTAELGAGVDERATLAGVLAGSLVTIDLQLNKPVPLPGADDVARRDWLFATLGADAVGRGARLLNPPGAPAPVLRIAVVPQSSVRLLVTPVDEHGIKGGEEAVFRVEVTADRPPDVAVTRPAENSDVLSTAVLEYTVEGRDDVGLAWVVAEYRIARRPPGSEGAPPEAPDAYVEAARTSPTDSTVAARILAAGATLDLAAIGARAGDELWLTALAADRYELDGARHEPVRSQVRKVRIISEDQLIEQVWAELGGVRRSAIRQSESLAALQTDLSRGREASGAARQQGAVSEAVARMAETIAKARQRVNDNGLKDNELSAVLRDARDLLEAARQRSAAALDALNRAAAAEQAKDAGNAAGARAEAQAAQDAAEDALARLAEALDRGQDAWSSRRDLERLIREQQALREATRAAEAAATGKSTEDLTPQERQQVERMAQDQEALARRAEEAIRKMTERAEQLRQNDPSVAQALQQASQRGQRSGLAETMQETARQMRQNQQRRAGEQQQRAEQTMQDMLEELKDAANRRDDVLRRELASLVQTIEALISRQQAALTALAAARQVNDLSGLDGPMIQLHTSTLAAVDQARGAGREAAPAAASLDSAQKSQAGAIAALRAQPSDGEEAHWGETNALAQLKEALAEAQKARQQAEAREQARQRAELKKVYRELLLEQTELRRLTLEAVGQPVDRRLRARLRELAERQEQVRLKARALLDATEDLRDSDLFSLSHERLDEAATAAGALLREARATAVTASSQGVAVRVLQAMLDALDDADRQDEPFRNPDEGNQDQGQQGGGQGDQQPRLIPEMAELKQLKSLQQEALARTREAAESADAELSAAAAKDAAALQAKLAEKAKALLEKLQAPGAAGGGNP